MKNRLKFTLINGLNDSSKGANNVDKLASIIKRYFPNAIIDTDEAQYGWIGLFIANYLWRLTWFVKIIPRIAEALRESDYVIGHSNGCNFTMQALNRIENRDINVIFLSGSLDSDYKFNQHFKILHNFHSKNDMIIKASKLFPKSDMGDGGAIGFTTKDERVRNYDRTKTIKGHSDWSKPEIIESTVSDIVKIVERNNENQDVL